jgi:hypothetical protein
MKGIVWEDSATKGDSEASERDGWEAGERISWNCPRT